MPRDDPRGDCMASLGHRENREGGVGGVVHLDRRPMGNASTSSRLRRTQILESGRRRAPPGIETEGARELGGSTSSQKSGERSNPGALRCVTTLLAAHARSLRVDSAPETRPPMTSEDDSVSPRWDAAKAFSLVMARGVPTHQGAIALRKGRSFYERLYEHATHVWVLSGERSDEFGWRGPGGVVPSLPPRLSSPKLTTPLSSSPPTRSRKRSRILNVRPRSTNPRANPIRRPLRNLSRRHFRRRNLLAPSDSPGVPPCS